MERIIYFKGKPKGIRVDNGPEFTANALSEWCEKEKIELRHIEPGKPIQNAFVERFNGSFRKDILDAYEFRDLDEVRRIAEEWREDYNQYRPHEALGNVSPVAYIKQKPFTQEAAAAASCVNH